MGRVVTIVNQKGGVGKTTTAVNLAACLAAAGRPTLLIDCDPQGNATSGLGIHIGSGDPTLYQVLIGQVDPRAALFPTALKHLKLLGADVNLIGAEVELTSHPSRETLLAQQLGELAREFDHVLLDCPPSLGLLTVNALTCCQGVLIPLQAEYYALEGLTRLLQTVTRVRRNLNPGLSLDGILLTMFDARNNLAHQVSEDVRGHFKDLVYQTVIPRNVRLSEAPSHGKPVILYDAKSAGAQSYVALAKEFLARHREKAGQASPS